jgi:ATP-binding cassette subfamily B protein
MTDTTEPTVSFAQARAILARTARLFRPYRGTIAVVVTTILVSSGLGVVNPLLIREIFDKALFPADRHVDLRLLVELSGVMIGIGVLTSAAGVVQTYLPCRTGRDAGPAVNPVRAAEADAAALLHRHAHR